MDRADHLVAGRRMRARVSGRNAGSTPALGDCILFLLSCGFTTRMLHVPFGRNERRELTGVINTMFSETSFLLHT